MIGHGEGSSTMDVTAYKEGYAMRGDDRQQAGMFSYIAPEARVPQDHPLRVNSPKPNQNGGGPRSLIWCGVSAFAHTPPRWAEVGPSALSIRKRSFGAVGVIGASPSQSSGVRTRLSQTIRAALAGVCPWP